MLLRKGKVTVPCPLPDPVRFSTFTSKPAAVNVLPSVKLPAATVLVNAGKVQGEAHSPSLLSSSATGGLPASRVNSRMLLLW